MLGVSGGIEPHFALKFTRTTKSLHGEDVTYTVHADIVDEYLEAKGLPKDADLPEYFVTAMTLDWHKRIDMQAVWQKWIDASISSTVNLPKEISLEETMDLYMYAWEKKLKGTTIFRDGCKKAGILTVQNIEEDKGEEELEDTASEEEIETETETETDKNSDETEERKKPKGYFSTCAECGSENVYFANGCVNCQDCGYSPCSV